MTETFTATLEIVAFDRRTAEALRATIVRAVVDINRTGEHPATARLQELALPARMPVDIEVVEAPATIPSTAGLTKFRVHFESSAAVGVEVEIEAESHEAARHEAQRLFDIKNINLDGLVDDLMHVDENWLKGWCEENGVQDTPITYATLSLDETGFEIVDCFEPENLSPPTA